jgi:hypothetical protein
MLLILNLIIKCIISSFILFQSGNLLLKIINFNGSNICFFQRSFLGIIFLSFVALFLNFFSPLNTYLNTTILSLIILSSFYDKLFPIKDILIVGLVTSLILALATTNNPDGGLYHLPYIQILNEEKIIFGLNNLHFRFALASMFQYVSAIFNNLYFGVEGITIPIAIIVALFLYFIHKELIDLINKDSEENFLLSLILLVLLISSLYSFNRYSNYGNDVSSHIYYFLIFVFSIKFFLNNHDDDKFKIILIFTIFLIINKITFVLSLLFLVIIFLNLKEKKINFRTIAFLFIFGFLWCLKNLLISGCIVFPIPLFCFETINWTNYELVLTEKLAGEAWSKSWPNQNSYANYQDFISDFNWLQTWLNTHFFVIVEKFSPILFFTFLSFLTFLIKGDAINKYNLNQYYKIFIIIYFISFLNFLLWFFYFPIYRYGYSFLVLFFALSLFLLFFRSIKKPNKIFLKRFFFLIIFCSYIVFGFKNINRIVNNFQKDYFNKPFPNIKYSYYDDFPGEIQKIDIGDKFSYYYAPDLCFYNKAPCTNYLNDKLKHTKYWFYDAIIEN